VWPRRLASDGSRETAEPAGTGGPSSTVRSAAGLLVRSGRQPFRSGRQPTTRLPLDGSRLLAVATPAGDRMVLDVASGTYLRLDGAAGEILDLLCRVTNEAEAAAVLTQRYGLAPERAHADVRTVLDTIQGLRRSGRPTALRRPTATAVRRHAAAWMRLPLAEQLAVAQAAVVLILVEVGLRTVDVATLARMLGVPLDTAGGGAQRLSEGLGDPSGGTDRPATGPAGQRGRQPPGQPQQQGGEQPQQQGGEQPRLPAGEQRRLAAVAWVLQRWPLPATCLRRALATGWVLRRHQPTMRLGLAPDGVTAHAWVVADGVAYDPGETVGAFRALGEPG